MTVDEQLATLKENHRRIQYLISEDSKYGPREDHQWPVRGFMDRVVGPSFDLERVPSEDQTIFYVPDDRSKPQTLDQSTTG